MRDIPSAHLKANEQYKSEDREIDREREGARRRGEEKVFWVLLTLILQQSG